MTNPVETQAAQVIVNKMTQAQYSQITPSDTEFYLITDGGAAAEFIENQNSNESDIKTWTGTLAQYNAITTKDPDTLYNITDDQTASAYEAYTKAEADSTFADVDLANLSNTGQKVIDGRWVYSYKALASGSSAPTTTPATFSLSSYLPDDGYDYEVIFTATCTTGTTSGNFVSIALKTDIILSNVYVCKAHTRSASSVDAYGSIILPVGSGRSVTVDQYSSNNGTYNLATRGYRRIGTNI